MFDMLIRMRIYVSGMDNIKTIREALGLSQIEMADRLGLHQSSVSRFETGDLPLDKRTLLAALALLAAREAAA